VVLDAPQIVVKLNDQRVLLAQLLAADNDADIALIRVPVVLPSLPPFGTSSSVWPGDWVPALGEPYGRDTFHRARKRPAVCQWRADQRGGAGQPGRPHGPCAKATSWWASDRRQRRLRAGIAGLAMGRADAAYGVSRRRVPTLEAEP
jgi:hypothetical protein